MPLDMLLTEASFANMIGGKENHYEIQSHYMS